jgi:hypothetical protein
VALVWRTLPLGQAIAATLLCLGALWLALHPALGASLLAQVARLYY